LQWLGILLAFAGIAVAFLWRPSTVTGAWGSVLLGDLLGLLGGMCWGATTVVIRTTRISTLPATQALLYQLTCAFVLLLPAAWLMGQTTFHSTPMVWGGLAFQAIVVSFASFLVWFWLLRHYLASRLGVFSFMTPLFGVLLGAWLLGESVEPSFLAGASMVLSGIVLVSGHGWPAWRWMSTRKSRPTTAR
jgi:drug/metabolite transporter (DMT)-like permease